MTVPGTKFSQIAPAPAPPATTDVLVGVQSPTGTPIDYLYTIAQLAAVIGLQVVAPPASSDSPGTPYQLAFDGGGNLYFCYAPNTWSKYLNTAPFGLVHILTEGGDFLDTEALDRLITEF